MSAKDYRAGRLDGLRIAARACEQGGKEAIQKEISARKKDATLGTKYTQEEIEILRRKMMEHCADVVILEAIYALRDTFGFGKKRLDAFYKNFLLKVEMTATKAVKTEEIEVALKKETGFDFDDYKGVKSALDYYREEK